MLLNNTHNNNSSKKRKSEKLYNNNLNLFNTEHVIGSGDVKIRKSGVYLMLFIIGTVQASQFTVFINNIPNETTTAGTNKGAGQLMLRQTLSLNKGDIVSVKNHTSSIGTVTVNQNAGGLDPGVNAEFILFKIAPPIESTKSQYHHSELSKSDMCLYDEFKFFLLKNKHLTPAGSDAYFRVFSINPQIIATESAVLWKLNGIMLNAKHTQGMTDVIVCKDGIYNLQFDCIADRPSQFTLFVNGKANISTTTGTGSGAGQCFMAQLVALHKGDVLQIVNHRSAMNPITTLINAGGDEVAVNACFFGN